MSRKLLITLCLITLFNLTFVFINAQPAQNSVANYYLFHIGQQNFSVYPFLPYSTVSLFSQNQYLVKELCTAEISGNYNIKGNSVVLSASHFGYSKYGVFTLSSGYAREFGQRVSFGLQVHYLMHHAEICPKMHSFTFDLSLYGHVSHKIGIGISAYNPANLKYGVIGNEKIPMKYILMLDYKINDKVLLAVAGSKELPGALDVLGTVCFKDKYYGFIVDTSLKKVGVEFSFWWKWFQFDVGGEFDYRLGFSPVVRLVYSARR